MATINFRIDQEAKHDPTNIYARFRGTNFDCEAPTTYTTYKKNWSISYQKLKTSADTDEDRNKFNENLADFKTAIIKKYNTDISRGTKINTRWLKDFIKSFNNQPTSSSEDVKTFLTSFSDNFAMEAMHKTNIRTGNKLKLRTIQDFQNSSNKLKAYELHSGTKLTFNDVNELFYNNFIEYLRTTELLGENTIGGIIDNLKAFLREADLLNYKVNPFFKTKEFRSPKQKTKDVYLNENEIQKIKNHNFELNSYLDNARDWLIIGVWTGLRISDLLSLTRADIVNGFIDNENFKTNIPVSIPLHPYVVEILNKRNGDFPRRISDTKFNEYIKEVAKQVGLTEIIKNSSKLIELKDKDGNSKLDKEGKKIHRKKSGSFPKFELVTSHICRRSFATNLYGTIDTLTIMKIIGHSTEKQFLDYIKTTQKEHAEKLSRLWAQKYN